MTEIIQGVINFRHLPFENRRRFAPAGLASILQGLVFVRRLFFCLWLIFLPAGVARPAALQDALSKEEAYHLAEAVQMRGLDRFIGDQAREALRGKLGGKIVEWAAEGMEEILGRTTDPSTGLRAGHGLRTTDLGKENLKELFQKDPEISKKLKAKIQKKLKAWLPSRLKSIIQKELLQGDSEKEIFAELDKTLNEQADRWLGGWYDGVMGQVRFAADNMGANLSPKNFSDIFESVFNRSQLDGYLAEQLGGMIGQSAAKGLQNSLFTVLRGELPEEAMQYLRMGPDKFAQYVEKGRAYLPGAQFRRLKNKMMQIRIVDLPNQVYGGILAASGAMHLAKFSSSCSGFFATCNWNELKRAKEVFETMVWQLKNKKGVTLTLGDFTEMIKKLGDQLGTFNWRAFQEMAKWNPAKHFLEKLDRIQAEFNKVDQFYDKVTGKVLQGFDKVLAGLEGELKKISGELLAPLTRPIQCFDGILAEDCPDVMPKLPDITTWAGLKKALGLEDGLFGKPGDKSPFKYATDELSKALASGAVKVTDALKITGPLAKILKVEKIPAKNPSNISDFDPVYLHNGEFFYTATDVTLPGEGLDFQFTRIYRSRSEFLGGLGWQWTHNLAERLIPWESPEGFGFTHVDGEGKKYFLKEVETTPEGFALQLSNGGRRYFDEEGKLTAIQNGSGKKWTLRYNEAGQLQKVVETKGREIRFNYYPNGLLKSLEDHTGRTWSYQYNEDHDLIAAATPGTAAFPEGKTTRYAYEDHRLTLIMDPKGQVYLQNYYGKGGRDAGKILAQQYGEHMAEARYDGDDAWVIDRRGVLHAYRHDDEGQLVNRFVPDSEDPVENRLPRARADFPILLDEEYDGWGNIVSVKYADGTERRLEIDAGNLVTKEVFGGEERFYKYDANDNIVEMDIPSRRLKLEFKYDVLDRLTAKEEMREGRPTLLTRYEYDPQGRLTQRIDPEGAAVHLAYDAAGRLMTIAEKGRSWHFDEQRRRMEHAAPGFKQEFFYDAGGEVVYAVDYNDLENPGDDVAVDLKYDARGRLVGEKMHDQWVNKSFDEKDQKIGVTYPNGLQIIREYQDGKIANVFANGRPLPQFFSGDTILNSDELSIVSPDLRRDANGNLLEDDRLVYRYDALNRLIWVQDKAGGGIVSYHYDPFSRVAREIRGGKVLRHFYDELNRIAAVRPDGTRQSFIYAADLDQPIAFYNNDDLYFYHLDPRGSVRQITDEAGNVMAHYDYLPFGERTVLASSGIENDLGYIGRPHDPTTGLVNLRYRFYAPRHHVFLTADPLGVKNKFSPQIRTPVNLSFHHGLGGSTRTAFPYRMDLFGDPRLSPTPDEDLFAYADGDPLRYYDPLGLFKVEMKKPPAWNSFRWNDDFHLQKLSLDLQAHDSVKLPSLFEPAPLWGCNRIPGAFLTQRLEF